MKSSTRYSLRTCVGVLMVALMGTGCVSDADPNDMQPMPMPMGGQDNGGLMPDCNQSIASLCEGNEERSNTPCAEDEAGCRESTATVCGREIRTFCREGVACPAIAYSCAPGSRRCDPDADGAACVEVEMGTGPCAQTLFCMPDGPACNAPPSCEANETISDEACDETEEGCRAVTKCGSTLYCREEPEINCAAEPSCEPGSLISDEPCDEGDDTCSEVTMCGKTIYCRVDALCDGLPNCAPNEESSEMPCGDAEMNCRAVEVCQSVIYCRSESDIIEANACGADLLPSDDFNVGELGIRDDVLYVPVSFSGGCETHDFTACYGAFAEGVPVSVRLNITHNANGDSCERVDTDDLEIDLKPLKTAYQEAYGAANGSIRVSIPGSAQSILYEF